MNLEENAPVLNGYRSDLPFDQYFMGPKNYESPLKKIDIFTKLFPTPFFYWRMFSTLMHLCWQANKGLADDLCWVSDSVGIAKALENSGGHLILEGLNHISEVNGPCVFIGNHMSTLETFILPGIIHPRKQVTFVAKRILCTMPVFGPVMRARNPVMVDRVNPRQDLETVLKEGTMRLNNGVSIIIFPQSTRMLGFNAANFNSLGIKLARRANVPVIPLALKTDAWGQGKLIKDFGKFTPHWPIHLRFGKAINIQGQGKEEHSFICDFIANAVKEWEKEAAAL